MMTNSVSGPPYGGVRSVLDDGPPRYDVARVLAAGAMTFLLSGDLPLAVRATRLLIGEDHASRRASGQEPRARRRSVWKRQRT
jgi:hypothetical protein